MVPVSRLGPVLLAAVTMAAALKLSRWRLTAAEARIAELDADAARLADEAQRAQRVKDDFLATLSHELRTPLNAMLGWVQLLRLHADNKPMRDHALEIVERSARAQVQIVTDLLDVSRIVAGRMHLAFDRVDLDAIVRGGSDALREAAMAKHVTLSVGVDPIAADVYGDPIRLRQVVWNLVSNAVKFTPPGGRVDVRLIQDDRAAAIVVRDTGVGIAPDVLPFVFDRFRQGDSSLTRPFGGLGLGLAIVYHLIELHGGSVHVTSDGRDRGATFTIRLPLRSPQP